MHEPWMRILRNWLDRRENYPDRFDKSARLFEDVLDHLTFEQDQEALDREMAEVRYWRRKNDPISAAMDMSDGIVDPVRTGGR